MKIVSVLCLTLALTVSAIALYYKYQWHRRPRVRQVYLLGAGCYL